MMISSRERILVSGLVYSHKKIYVDMDDLLNAALDGIDTEEVKTSKRKISDNDEIKKKVKAKAKKEEKKGDTPEEEEEEQKEGTEEEGAKRSWQWTPNGNNNRPFNNYNNRPQGGGYGGGYGGGADPIDRLTEVGEDTEEGDILDLTEVGEDMEEEVVDILGHLTEVGEDMEAEGMEEAAEGMEEVVGFVGFSVINFLHGS